MLKQLRLKFVAVIMVIVTATLCLVLGTVYRSTAQNLESASLAMMRSAAARPPQSIPPEEGRQPYFTLQIGRRGEVTASGGGFYDLSDQDFVKELLEAVFASQQPSGVLETQGLRFCRVSSPGGQTLVFADVSAERAALRHLARNCVLTGGACFLLFLGVSLLLARWMVKPVERAWEEQRQFVSDASHELKTPLTVIMTNAELLQGTDEPFAQNILVMSRQMRQLVERLLELARADSGRDQIVLVPLDLSALAGSALLPFEPVFFERGLTLSSALQPGLWVKGSPSHLRQVLDILLDNAQKYASPGGEVVLTLNRQGRHSVRLSLSNPGPELSREELKQIFKRFYRVDQARSRDGSFGLGLSIAQQITAAHHGKLWAESQEGLITFFLELPLYEKNGTA